MVGRDRLASGLADALSYRGRLFDVEWASRVGFDDAESISVVGDDVLEGRYF